LVIIDHNKNLNRIIDRLKADTAVFDEGETTGKPRQILFGVRPNDEALDESMKPYIYCTTRDFLQKTRRDFGVSTSDSINQITTEYEINVIADSRSRTERMEEQLYDIIKNTRTALEFDPLFSDPANQGTDPIFSRSAISEVTWDTDSRGKLTGIVTIILLATIGQTLVITIPGFGDLSLLSDTGDEGRNSTDVENDEGDSKISKGANVGSRFFEYEYNTTTYQSIETLINADNELALILKYPSGDRTYNTKLTFQRDTKRFDGIHTVILQANKITV